MVLLKGRIYPDSLPDEFRFWKVSVLVLPMPYNPKVGSLDAGKSPVGLLLPDLAAAVVGMSGRELNCARVVKQQSSNKNRNIYFIMMKDEWVYKS
jgi:hypothetical protein